MRKLLYINFIIKNIHKSRSLLESIPHAILNILRGNKEHRLLLPHPTILPITPPNLLALIDVWGHLRLKEVDYRSKRLIWELAPEVHIATQTEQGLDIVALAEVFIGRPYGSNFKDMRVLDIGGYKGESAIFFALNGAASVACIEPSPVAAEHILENIALSGFENRIKYYPVAIGSERGTQSFFITAEEASGSSLFPTLRASNLSYRTAEVPVYTLEDILEELGWSEADFAKVDCEGCEYMIFASTPTETLRRVKVWAIETHRGTPSIVETLRKAGYEVASWEEPDELGLVRAWLPGAPCPWAPC
ncbi:MAG: FkbM family methyltransferase [Bacteroidia bacterium]|nr:FkbM family methyltransferase [Bacteroidia bacterium]MDW8015368.1 FkbM family methyltransferase [Bacteroidia bacterium]